MSLILEALRKLERDKQAPERGFLVVGAGSLPPARRRAASSVATLVVLILAAGSAVFLLRPAPARAPAPAQVLAPPPAQAPSAPPTMAAPVPALAPAPAVSPATTPNPAPPAPATMRGRVAPVATPAAEPSYRLTAISERDGHPVAVLNDRLVREGDRFEGITIVRIGAAEIEIEVAGKRQVVGF